MPAPYSPPRYFMNGPDPETIVHDPGSPEAARAARAQRLALALRENLKRRKSRLRGRREIAADQNAQSAGRPDDPAD